MKLASFLIFICLSFISNIFSQSGANDPSFNVLDIDGGYGANGINNTVLTSAIQSDGKILIGGIFTNVGGLAKYRIARFNSDGTIDSSFVTSYNGSFGFGSFPATSVKKIVVQPDGKILVGGYFHNYGNQGYPSILRLNSDGSLDNTFNPGSLFLNDTIHAIKLLSSGKILVGATTNRLKLLNSDGTLDVSFNSGGSGPNGSVYAIDVLSNGKIIIAGEFTQYNLTSNINRLVILNTDGSIGQTVPTSGTNGSIYNIKCYDDNNIYGTESVLIPGNFTDFSGSSVKYIAKLNILPNGNFTLVNSYYNWTSYLGTNSTIFAMDVFYNDLDDVNEIIIGGSFTSFEFFGTNSPITANYIAKFRSDNGEFIQAFNTTLGANNTVRSLSVQTDGKVIIGGSFTQYNNIDKIRLARLKLDGSLDTAFFFNTGANNNIEAIAIQSDGKIIIGGSFTNFNATINNRITRLNSDGSLDATFDTGSGANQTVRCLGF